jgi:hypothetical protein
MREHQVTTKAMFEYNVIFLYWSLGLEIRLYQKLETNTKSKTKTGQFLAYVSELVSEPVSETVSEPVSDFGTRKIQKLAKPKQPIESLYRIALVKTSQQ